MGRIKWFSLVRVLGLFLVLTYHLFYDVMPGGFFGVDIFFTFSGYLIVGLIIEDVRRKGRFNLLAFFRRRLARIVLPLFLSIVFTLPFVLLVSMDFTVGIGKQAAAALGFVTNWFEILSGGSYEAQLLPHLYIHTWSLSVEMHFYIIAGLSLAFLLALCRLLCKGKSERALVFRIFISMICTIGALCSFLFMRKLHFMEVDLSKIYFNTFSRLFPFCIGGLAATIVGVGKNKNFSIKRLSTAVKALSVFALIAVAALAADVLCYLSAHYNFDDEAVYQYGFLFTSLLTVALIYAARALHGLTPNIKEPVLLIALANLSYDIYLVHWPLYIIFSSVIMNNVIASAVTVAVSLLLSALMYYGVERLFLVRGKKSWQKNLARAAVFAFIIVCAVKSGEVIKNASIITEIEKDFAAGNIDGDINGIYFIKNQAGTIETEPIAYVKNYVPLQANLMPPPPLVSPLQAASETPKPAQKPKPAETPKPSETQEPEEQADAGVSTPSGVSIIGDSVSLGAQSTLTSTILNCSMDAKVSRTIKEGHDVFLDIQNKGNLREYVVIALGTNGHNNYAKLLTQIIDDLEPGHKLIFVTPFDGRSNENAAAVRKTAEWIRTLPEQYSYITVADWNALISSQTNLLTKDKVHVGGKEAMRLYTECVEEALRQAQNTPAK